MVLRYGSPYGEPSGRDLSIRKSERRLVVLQARHRSEQQDQTGLLPRQRHEEHHPGSDYIIKWYEGTRQRTQKCKNAADAQNQAEIQRSILTAKSLGDVSSKIRSGPQASLGQGD